MATDTPSVRPETVEDLIAQLGGISPSRIRINHLGAAKERDVIAARRTPERRLCELVDNVLVEIAYDLRASVLGGAPSSKLMDVVEKSNLGFVILATGFVGLRPGLVRIPNVAFFAWERFPRRKVPDVEILNVAPDLTADVFRRGNTEAELARKRRDYFDAGVRLVWLIRPASKSAEVFHSPTEAMLIPPTGALDGEEVVRGFKLPLKTLFAYLRRRA